MRNLYLTIVLLSLLLSAAAASDSEKLAITNEIATVEQQPATFTKNIGQWDDNVEFRVAVGDVTVWLTSEGVYHQFIRKVPGSGLSATENLTTTHRQDSDPPMLEQKVVFARFEGANSYARAEGSGLTEYKCNYFLGSDPSRWKSDVPNYESVILEDIYNGIDFRYYIKDNRLEYDVILTPGADPSQISISYAGVDDLVVGADGSLTISKDWVTISESRPAVLQEGVNIQGELDASFRLNGDNSFTIDVKGMQGGEDAIVIDPSFSYSTYLGGSGDETWPPCVSVDAAKQTYVVGTSLSSDFPVLNQFMDDQPYSDVVVSCIAPLGSAFMYSTYIGGELADYAEDCITDDFGNVYICGHTWSEDFPTVNPYQAVFEGGDEDAIILKLGVGGGSLVYSTYLGGGNVDQALSIAIDGDGNAFIGGVTESANFKIHDPYQPYLNGSSDGFVTKLNVNGDDIVFSTYLGGSGTEHVNDIDIARIFQIPQGYVYKPYVTGVTTSSNFPIYNAYQATHGGGSDAFVTCFASSGLVLSYSTYLGGSNEDIGWGIAANDLQGTVTVVGETFSYNFPLEAPYQSTLSGGRDAFVTRFGIIGTTLAYSTYLGGSGVDAAYAIHNIGLARVAITGLTGSIDFPLVNPLQPSLSGPSDAFVTELNANGSSVLFSTYLGGGSDEFGNSICFDNSWDIYVSGFTSSLDFPVYHAVQPSYAGGARDFFVTKLTGYESGNFDFINGVDIDDVVSGIAYIFAGGQAPNPLESGDCDCSSGIDIDDIVYLINFIFSGGNILSDPDGDVVPDC